MMNTCCINSIGKIENCLGRIIKTPAVQIIPHKGIFVGFDEFDKLCASMTQTHINMTRNGVIYMPQHVVIELADLPVAHVCYIVRRMADCDDRKFIKTFNRMAKKKRFHDWLESEMQYYPIDAANT